MRRRTSGDGVGEKRRKIDLAGRQFARWTVEAFDGIENRRTMWRCRCACGEVRIIRSDHLRSGLTKSCGCWKVEDLAVRVSHGRQYSPTRRHHPLEAIYSGMIQRCVNPKNHKYPDYGGRGIRVCDRWMHGVDGKTGFECFIEDVRERPGHDYSIDRYPDNDGNYEPSNFRWATKEQQTANRRPRRKTPPR